MEKEYQIAGSDCCGVLYYVSGWDEELGPQISCSNCGKRCGVKAVTLRPVSAEEMRSRIHSIKCQIGQDSKLSCNCK